jgi:hypothetical protein
VLARPDTAPYRVWKFANRHRAGLGTTTVLAAFLIGFAFRERTLRAAGSGFAPRFIANAASSAATVNVAPSAGSTRTRSHR